MEELYNSHRVSHRARGSRSLRYSGTRHGQVAPEYSTPARVRTRGFRRSKGFIVIQEAYSSSECLDWTARQAPPELRRSVSNWSQLTPGKLFICTLQSLVPTTLGCHDEARRRPTCGRWSSLPSLGSKVAHPAGSCCRRSLSDRTCPPPVVHTVRAPRCLLLRGNQSHTGMTKV